MKPCQFPFEDMPCGKPDYNDTKESVADIKQEIEFYAASTHPKDQPKLLREVAQHCETEAKRREERNEREGVPE